MMVEVSYWNAMQMPVVIEGLFGYETGTVELLGGTKRYHWVRLWNAGLELCVYSPTNTRECNEGDYQRRQAE